MDNYVLCIIYTKQSIPDVLNSLYSYTTSDDQLGPIRKDFKRDQKTRKYIESNRKLTIVKKSLFTILKNNGLTVDNSYDFLISEYSIREDNYPPKDSIDHLFFPLRKIDDPSSTSQAVQIINNKMKYFTDMKIISDIDFKIKNNGIIVFNNSVDIITRIIIKIILDDIEDGFRISWCKRRYFYGQKDKIPI